MTPDKLRSLSLRTFQAAVLCLVVGILVLIAVPNPSFRSPTDPVVKMIGTAAIALLGIAAVANLVSLVSGAIAWARGAKRCPWIFVCALAILAPAGVWVAAALGL